MRVRLPNISMVEVLVIIAIIGILAALLIPAIQATREAQHQKDSDPNVRIECTCNCCNKGK